MYINNKDLNQIINVWFKKVLTASKSESQNIELTLELAEDKDISFNQFCTIAGTLKSFLANLNPKKGRKTNITLDLSHVKITDSMATLFHSMQGIELKINYDKKQLSPVVIKIARDNNIQWNDKADEKNDIEDKQSEIGSDNEELHDAVVDGDLKRVQQLILQGHDVNSKNADDETPLHLAAECGYPDIAKILIQEGAKVDEAGKEGSYTPLICAVENNQYDVAVVLLEAGADPNCQLATWTPMHVAASYDYLDLFKLLIQKGGILNNTTMDWGTPVETAIDFASKDIVKYLLDKKLFEVNILGESDEAALHIAVGRATQCSTKRNDDTTVSELLIHHGADVNFQTSKGLTPLHIAARDGNIEQIKLLIQQGASPSILDKSGCKPYDIAIQKAEQKSAEFLRLAEKGLVCGSLWEMEEVNYNYTSWVQFLPEEVTEDTLGLLPKEVLFGFSSYFRKKIDITVESEPVKSCLWGVEPREVDKIKIEKLHLEEEREFLIKPSSLVP